MLDPDRRHLIAYLAAAAVLVVIAVRFLGQGDRSAAVPSISMAAPAAANPKRARLRARAAPVQLIWVDVAGAVRRPGLYSLPKGARAAAAITRAGGVTRHANGAAVNLAARLADGQQIFVPRGREAPLGGAGVAGPAASGAVESSSATAAAPGPSNAPISLSNASEAQLEELDGVGPALAQRIIQYREQHGGFHSIDELQQVSGIGPKRFEALKSAIAP